MAIEFKNISFTYNQGTPFEYLALKNINFTIKENSFVAIVGHTGSGKSTLMQLFNGLLKPSTGQINIGGFSLTSTTGNKGLKPLRKKVGLVFQLPENQLFEETILKETMFAPLNFGFSKEEAKKSAEYWLSKVKISEELYKRSPFDLSGGQKRRVAIASVMAAEPEILCLDEPAAGLDPEGKRELFELLQDYQNQGHTIILVTHNMEDIVNHAQEMLVLEEGKIIAQDSPNNLFQKSDWLRKHHLLEPEIYRFKQLLEKKGFPISKREMNLSETINELVGIIHRKDHQKYE